MAEPDWDRHDYLRKIFGLDPTEDAGAVVALRAERFDGRADDGAAPTPVDGRSARERDRQRLAALRDQFWQLGSDQLESALAKTSATDQPDLQRWWRRLRRAADARPSMLELVNDPVLKQSFRDLRELVIASPTDAVPLRQHGVDRAIDGASQAAVRRLRRRYPDVAALEPDYFDKLGRLSKERKLTRSPAVWGWSSFVVGWVIILFIRYLIRWLGE